MIVNNSPDAAPEVSVIMPVHDCEKYLGEQLDSLLRDCRIAIEVIAIDDGSTDRSLEILQAYAQKDDRLRILRQANSGPGAARNAGLRVARGEWIAFADADDLMPSTGLERWLDQAREQDVDVLVGNSYRFRDQAAREAAEPFFVQQPWGQVTTGAAWITHCVQRREWPHYVWLQLVRRAHIERHELAFNPDILHEDVLWTTTLALATQRMGFCQTPTYGYRRHAESIVFSASPARRQLRGKSYLFIIQTLLNHAQRQDLARPVRFALRRHVFHEVLCFIDLLRKDIEQPQVRRELARSLQQMGVWRPLIGCARWPTDLLKLKKAHFRIKCLAGA
ncbi:glycosyltransferase [Achromobacter ruhlandii]|uniref:glycosyltransferase n=1 Tax=Achromobacter ruhlandii TaxID=72557 RepID=UPI003BA08C43